MVTRKELNEDGSAIQNMDVSNSVTMRSPESNADQENIKVSLPDPNHDQEEFWSKANDLLGAEKDVLLRMDQSDEHISSINSLNEILRVIEEFSKKKTVKVTTSFRNLITFLAVLLDTEKLDIELGHKIVKILISLSEKNVLPMEAVNYVSVVCFLFRNCKRATEKTWISLVRYLKKMCSYLQKSHVKIGCIIEKQKLLPHLKTAFTHFQFYTSDAGLEIIGSFLALDAEFIVAFHKHIYENLPAYRKVHAINVGKIYFRIWENLADDERPAFEEDYIQWFMERACTLGRTDSRQRHLSLNVQALLTGLHQSRKGIKFTKVITKLYTPILWKYLNCDNSAHRCNATEVFMDAYPLEKPREGETNYSKNLRKQHDEMLQLLDDPCPTIRTIAIKGICLNMQYFWITFQNGTCEKVLKKFVSDLVLDGSSCDVRKAVYQGLTILLKCEESHNLLKHVLPLLKDFIHDENQSVRQAFIFMLLKIKELDCKIKYYEIVNMENVAARLATDTTKNRTLIVRLIFSSFFNEKLSMDDSFSRVCKFIKVNPTASRYLARYSNTELKFEVAVRFMCLILLKLKKAISPPSDKNESSKEDESNDSQRYESSKSSSNVLGMIENINITDRRNRHSNLSNDSQASSVSEFGDLKHILEPRITHGLLDFVGMLWLIHGKTLHKIENKERLDELYIHIEKCLPVILRHFRGTHAYFGALNVASMVPFSKIYHVTTVAGSCKTMLCNLTVESPSSEYHSFIHALCKWNRGGDVIELAMEGIDEAFRSQSLNESAIMPKTRSGKRVKFDVSRTNPMLALRMLNELFSSPTDQNIIFSKNIDELRTLLKMISKIKALIKCRIEKEDEQIDNDSFDDSFFVECLTLYGNLIIMFGENNVERYDFWKSFDNYLSWCNTLFTEFSRTIGSNKEQTVDKLIFTLLRVPLRQCTNLIALGKCDVQKLAVILQFVDSLLSSDHGLYFVDTSFHLVKHLLVHCQTHRDELLGSEIMTIQFPEIMEKLLNVLTEEVFSKQRLIRFIENIAEFKRNLTFIYIASLKLYPEVTPCDPSYKIMDSFCQSLINVVLFPITECETLNVDQDVKNLPFVANLMATVFTSQLELASALFYVLGTIIQSFTERDGLKLLACTSLMYTFTFSKNKIPKSDLLKVVKIVYNKVQRIPTEDGCVAVVMNYEYSINDRTIIDVEDTTERAIKEIGLHILVKVAEKLGGSLPGNGVDVAPVRSNEST